MKANNLLKLATAGLLICGMMSTNAMAASTTGTASAQIVTNISIVNTAGLSFGGVIPNLTTAGSVTVTPGGAVSNSGVTLIAPLANRAVFDVAGDPSTAYTASVDSTINLTGAGAPMIASLSLAQENTGSTLDGTGVDTIYVGGVLPVGVAQATGSYSGTFAVTVNY